MAITLKNVNIYQQGTFKSGDFSFPINTSVSAPISDGTIVSNLHNCFVFRLFVMYTFI